ncbi:MAG TPA: VCBS repeat-containing protein [Gemmatimonadaceae bacterium]|nr:VCBS repeat-containing protein [Gemmatimonadaceae bacterium]
MNNRTIATVVTLTCVSLAGCAKVRRAQGERLARTYCALCHLFPEPQLLDKRTWENGVLPQMALRLGVRTLSTPREPFSNPYMLVIPKAIPQKDFEKIVEYYREAAPDSLPDPSLGIQTQVDPPSWTVAPFASRMSSSGIVTLLKADSARQRIYIGEAGSNTLRVYDFERRLLTTLKLGSPPTDVVAEDGHLLVLESGILDPNDEARGRLEQYDVVGHDSLRFDRVVIDSLLRPVFVAPYDFANDGAPEFVIAEFGDNRGRLALYVPRGATYQRQDLALTPGAIHVEIRDLTGDGAPDIVALFAQGDERIELFENDGTGHFSSSRRKLLARFPPVYGSMYFGLYDFNGDGHPDILYVNGDNFDYSRVLKPYHGVRILENDGKNNFHERYFFPVHGAARAAVADFDRDGNLDIFITSNFADRQRHPERGVVYLENLGGYQFRPYAFSAAAASEWNLMTVADLNHDGRLDVIVGAMNLASISRSQRGYTGRALAGGTNPFLVFESSPGQRTGKDTVVRR